MTPTLMNTPHRLATSPRLVGLGAKKGRMPPQVAGETNRDGVSHSPDEW